MKELKELGFEYLPTLNEFRKRISLYSIEGYHSLDRLNRINKYGDFIDQQPKLGDFVPCVDGVPINIPEPYNYKTSAEFRIDLSKYQQALERVKFEGFSIEYDTYYQTKRMTVWYRDEDKAFQIWRELILPTGKVLTYNQNLYKTYEHAINEGIKFKIK